MIEHTVKLWADYHPGWTSKSFYRALYDGARLEADKIHDRQKVAAHWLRQLKWFSRQVTLNAQTGNKLDTLIEIVAACKGHYEEAGSS